MAVMRVRSLMQLARDGETMVIEGWEYTLENLYADTQPAEWTPQLDSLDDWQPNTYEIEQYVAAQRVADTYNASKPWESGG